MSNHIAVEEHATHYKTFLHWDDADQPLVTIFTDMVDPQESRPRLEHKFSCIVFPDALITNWDRSGESESQTGVCAGSVLYNCSTFSARILYKVLVQYVYSTCTVLVVSMFGSSATEPPR
jgi:hypothetical protein